LGFEIPKYKGIYPEELNIGLDSMVFIDDNPVERESVKRELPEVVVPDFPQDSSELVDFATELYNNISIHWTRLMKIP